MYRALLLSLLLLPLTLFSQQNFLPGYIIPKNSADTIRVQINYLN